MEPESSLPCSQEPATVQINPVHKTQTYLSKIHCNIIISPTLNLTSGSFPPDFPTFPFSHIHLQALPISSFFITIFYLYLTQRKREYSWIVVK
jgi:hypothetical protein